MEQLKQNILDINNDNYNIIHAFVTYSDIILEICIELCNESYILIFDPTIKNFISKYYENIFKNNVCDEKYIKEIINKCLLLFSPNSTNEYLRQLLTQKIDLKQTLILFVHSSVINHINILNPSVNVYYLKSFVFKVNILNQNDIVKEKDNEILLLKNSIKDIEILLLKNIIEQKEKDIDNLLK
jgi:hypothetical protein